MTQATNYTELVTLANIKFPHYGITEIITGYEGFEDENEVATTSTYELPTEVREWIKEQVTIYNGLSISEKVLSFVSASDVEVTCLGVAKRFNMESGTNLILSHLAKAGLITERIERNGTRKFSTKQTDTHVVIDGVANYSVRAIDSQYPQHKVVFTGSETGCWAYINKCHEYCMNNEPIQRSHTYDSQF